METDDWPDQDALHDEGVSHLDSVRLHGMSVSIVVVADVRVEEVADSLLLLAGDGHEDGGHVG